MEDEQELIALHPQRLQWSLQALARPAQEQLTLFPDFVCPGDELVIDFDEEYRAIQGLVELEGQQQDALTKLDAFLEEHSGEKYGRMYLDPAGLDEPEWTEIREMARAALSAFGWKDELPPMDRGVVYVGAPGS